MIEKWIIDITLAGILSYQPVGSSSSARCYSTDTGVSREILVPHPPPLLSNGGMPLYHPTCSTPLPPIPPLISEFGLTNDHFAQN